MNIKKTIKTTTITAFTADVDNGKLVQRDFSPIVVIGAVKENKAVKLVRAENNLDKKTPVYIGDIHTDEITYTMDAETFVKNAQVVTE